MSNHAPFIPPMMSDAIIDLYHADKVNVDFSAVKAAGIAVTEIGRVAPQADFA